MAKLKMDKIISVMIPGYLLEELDCCAKESATTRSQIIRSSIREYCRERIGKIPEPMGIYRV